MVGQYINKTSSQPRLQLNIDMSFSAHCGAMLNSLLNYNIVVHITKTSHDRGVKHVPYVVIFIYELFADFLYTEVT